MLGHRKVGTSTNKSKLEEKDRMIRNHFICEEILKINNFDSMFLLIEKAKHSQAQLWIDLEFYQKVDYIKREIKRGTYRTVSEKFSRSSTIVSNTFNRCIRIELKKYSSEVEGVFTGYHGNLETEEEILHRFNNLYQ